MRRYHTKDALSNTGDKKRFVRQKPSCLIITAAIVQTSTTLTNSISHNILESYADLQKNSCRYIQFNLL